jgi:hypothetical protein
MRTRIITTTCIAGFASFSLAACGGDTTMTTRVAAAVDPHTATTRTTPASTGGTAAAAPSASASPSPARAGTTSAAHAASPSRAPAPWFTAHVLPCVTPNGTQTLDGTTRPGYSVSFNTTYGDGRHGDTHGGVGIIAPDGSGAFHTSWRVDARAPLGSVHLLVGTGGRGGSPDVAEIVFTVASTC